MGDIPEKAVKFFENGSQVLQCKWRKHFAYIDGILFAAPERHGKAVSFTVAASNGKNRKTGQWYRPTYYRCIAFGDLADKIESRYTSHDEMECIARLSQYNKADGKTYSNFIVSDVPRIKPDDPSPSVPAPSGSAKQGKENDDDLPF